MGISQQVSVGTPCIASFGTRRTKRTLFRHTCRAILMVVVALVVVETRRCFVFAPPTGARCEASTNARQQFADLMTDDIDDLQQHEDFDRVVSEIEKNTVPGTRGFKEMQGRWSLKYLAPHGPKNPKCTILGLPGQLKFKQMTVAITHDGSMQVSAHAVQDGKQRTLDYKAKLVPMGPNMLREAVEDVSVRHPSYTIKPYEVPLSSRRWQVTYVDKNTIVFRDELNLLQVLQRA